MANLSFLKKPAPSRLPYRPFYGLLGVGLGCLGFGLSGCKADNRFPSLAARPLEQQVTRIHIAEDAPPQTVNLPDDPEFNGQLDKILETAEKGHRLFEKQANQLSAQIAKLHFSCKAADNQCLSAKSQNESWITAQQNLTSLASSGRDPLLNALMQLEEKRVSLLQHTPPISGQRLNEISDRLQDMDKAEKEKVTELGETLQN
ncbi:hypothetical protein FBY51_0951 [Zymomonas mobilis]|uniref:hypothetical protein n=1 Tax=Zymomonas mobilis TaxID=542 RepID=UPI00026D84FC|nr:hypothetical protein [Zymomonas mobilis]AFN57147.1 hypothetical protein ZZ6_1267 [Zymomonas mobilis subsp. mobilis ATCC 29191]TQK77410.1 hypothetical protein FBY53_0029 [Zymomonas mobilis]TQL15933.1 hypothetical protein FBY51_0951 [Zymomonas mobilis]GEB87906.1 hypothetical protein ZMO01_12460 [Zymomonas mobilis subsp. mobilis]